MKSCSTERDKRTVDQEAEKELVKDMNKVRLICYMISKTKESVYRTRILEIYNELCLFPILEEKLSDQVMSLKQN